MKSKVAIFWFRRDLRLDDNVGLHQALSSSFPVLPIFIFDSTFLEKIDDKKDRRVDYIHQALGTINTELKKYGAKLTTYFGNPLTIFKELSEEYEIQAVYCNRDYEPQTIDRDRSIYDFLKSKNSALKAYKDQVIFDKNDILKKDETPYTVYTPYAKKWRENLSVQHYRSVEINTKNFYQQAHTPIHSLAEIGFEKTAISHESPQLDAVIIDKYDQFRDYPAMQHTTQLGIALRFGTISIRTCVKFALQHNQTWLSELIWREFFMQILYHFPKVVERSFKQRYDLINWRNNEDEFQRWCDGKTGYPLVDAGMRQLNETGFMHNRVRMVVASFLCKHLLIDWRWGEAYFAQKLNDYDLSANNGNWQWAAGCGCDAAPYFRVFSPERQTEKFDKDMEYIRSWIPEFGTKEYPETIIDHDFARKRALEVYGKAVKDKN